MNRDHDDSAGRAARPGSGPGVGPDRCRIDPMTLHDVGEVSRIERRCFTNPWPVSAYRRELQNSQQNHYLVLRREAARTAAFAQPEPAAGNGAGVPANGRHGAARVVPRRTLLPLPLARRLGGDQAPAEPIVGFAGMWVMYDEAHVTTIGVDSPWRGRGLGELLLQAMFDEALRRRAGWLTLEVRVSNDAAQALYRKYGLATQGTRRRYYSDNDEDALIMWSRALADPDYLAEIGTLRRRLIDRLGYEPAGLAAWPELRSAAS